MLTNCISDEPGDDEMSALTSDDDVVNAEDFLTDPESNPSSRRGSVPELLGNNYMCKGTNKHGMSFS